MVVKALESNGPALAVCADLVAANCSVEVLSYSAYGTCDPTAYYGYVKLNGVTKWQASWCGKFPAVTGITIIVVDPFLCTIQKSRNFDIYRSTTAADELSNYYLQLANDSVIVGVSADESARYLHNALSTLQELGVDLSDLQLRGSFAFVAQKGHPYKTLIHKVLSEEESHTAPAHLSVSITGIKVLIGLVCNLSKSYSSQYE